MADRPMTKREARATIRAHWAEVIACSDMGDLASFDDANMSDVYESECIRIAGKLDPETWRR